MICKLCRNNEIDLLYSNSDYDIYHCRECDFKQKQHHQAHDFNEEAYEDGQWIAWRDKSRDHFRSTREKGFGTFEKYWRPGSFLEIGPGDGWFLKHAQDRGFDPIGIETSKRNVEYIEKLHGIKCFHGRLEEAAIEKNSINNVLISHLIEHIENPAELLLQIKDILAPGGVLVILTPNAVSYTERLLGRYNSFYDVLDHVSFFSPDSIVHLASATGFDVKNMFTQEGCYSFANKILHLLKIKMMGRGIASPQGDSEQQGIDYNSNNKFALVSTAKKAVRKSAIVWGQVFKIFAWLEKGSGLCCVLTKKQS